MMQNINLKGFHPSCIKSFKCLVEKSKKNLRKIKNLLSENFKSKFSEDLNEFLENDESNGIDS